MTQLPQYVLGLDGGGSKTECVLVREDGVILGRGRGGGVNRNFISEAGFEKSVHQALRQATQAAPDVRRIERIVGSMGCDGASLRAFAHDYAVVTQHIRWVGEALPARATSEIAYERLPDVVVVAGTGSLAVGWYASGEQRSLGGVGATIGDEGSAYWIGVRALKRMAESFDGRQPFDRFARAMGEALAVPNLGVLVNRVYGGGKQPMTRDEIAAVAPHVSALANAGDLVAIGLFRSAAQELAFQANAMIRILGRRGQALSILLYGGVFRAGDVMVQPLQEAVQRENPLAEFLPPVKCTVIGAAALALKSLGIDPAAGAVRDNLLEGGRKHELI